MPSSLAAWPGGAGAAAGGGGAGVGAAEASGAAPAGPSAAIFLLGTAFIVPDEPEPRRGRILVLEYVPPAAATAGGSAAAGQGQVRGPAG
ncbi:hypothetical protein GPECTOR_33g573 [Gonium pectorale]|uniref:Uncharacterized protein n=1 Tax=Gonium pectorale TaxID=33097 RepID=A0A150GCW3_GONPE|nr:hypothetical protein GPECTOR_33g573 [Gonium pectorale]|eukprot:KXZ47691.1 hypothetical protein GPECTOR_33g573 [Gonium pectorale]